MHKINKIPCLNELLFVCLFAWVLWHIKLYRLFNTKSILFK